MSLLLESIKIENRQLHHVDLHNKRFNNARKVLFGKLDYISLENIIEIPHNLNNSTYKCRVTTNGENINYEILPYKQREIKTLKLVHMNNIDYTYKTNNRDLLNEAYNKREDCDDIIIIKNGMVTDAWAANLIVFDGKKWITPLTPLLKGTQREFLLVEKIISEKNIHFDELHRYKSIKLINAMISFEKANTIDIDTCISF